MRLLETLARVPAGCQASLLLRHAEREPIADLTRPLDAPLTEAGLVAAAALGEALARRFPEVVVFHSPVARCLHTAERLAAGVLRAGGAGRVAAERADLGGPYLRQPERVLRGVQAPGEDFIREWFDHGYPEEAIQPFEDAAFGMLSAFCARLAGPGSACHVHVSHDWNVLLVRERFLGLRHEEVGWPDFLDGVVAHRDGGTLCLAFHGHERRLPWPFGS